MQVDTSYETNGWTFSSTRRPISGAPALLALGRRLADPYSSGEAQVSPFCVHGATRSLKPCMCGSALVMGVRMHMPEAVFGANRLVLSHKESGFTLVFNAEGALRCWARDSVVGDATSYAKCAPAEMPVWRQRMHAASLRTSTAVDWTFCCGDYGGEREEESEGGPDAYGGGSSDDVACTGDASEVACKGGSCGAPNNLAPIMSGLIGLQKTASGGGKKAPNTAGGSAGHGAGGEAPTRKPHGGEWREHRGPGLDMALLKRREEILYSAEVPLYEDHLHDHGLSSLTVRIRVMSSCFLVLLRHTLRIDGVLIMQRESRVFHKFGDPVVIRSHRKAQKPLPPLPSSAALRAVPPHHASATLRAPPAQPMQPATRMPPPPTDAMTTRMPPPPPMDSMTTRMPPRTNVDSMTTRMPPPPPMDSMTTRMPPPPPMDSMTTRMPPRANVAPAPGGLPVTRMPPPMAHLPMEARMPLDEQGIAEILQAVEPLESTEEVAIAPVAAAGAVDVTDAPTTGSGTGVAPVREGVPPPGPTASTKGAAVSAGRAPVRLVPSCLPLAPLGSALSVLAISADCSLLVGGDCDGALLLCRLQADTYDDPASMVTELWRTPAAHRGAVLGAAVTPSSGWVFSCGEDGSCAVWRATGGVVRTAPSRRWELDCKSADRVHFYEEAKGGGGEGVGSRVRHSFAVVQALACEPDADSTCFAAAVGASVFLLDRTESAPRARLPAGRVVTALAYIGARRCLCASGYGGVRVWADYGHGPAALLEYKGPLDTLAVSPDARYAASGAQDSTLVLWPLGGDAADGVGDVATGVADGPAVSLQAADGTSADDGAAAAAAPPSDALALAALAPSATALAAAVAAARHERPMSEAEAARLSGSALFFGGCYDQKVGPVGWDAAGTMCASAGGRNVVVWDMGARDATPPVRQNGRSMLLFGHRAAVHWVAFQPASKDAAPGMLASIASDGRLLIHALAPAAGDGAGAEGAADGAAARGGAMTVGRPPQKARSPPGGAPRRHARLVREPAGVTPVGVAAREAPALWLPGGWVIFSTRRGELALVRAPGAAEEDEAHAGCLQADGADAAELEASAEGGGDTEGLQALS